MVKRILAAVLAATCSLASANTAPTVTITSPAVNANFVAQAAVTLSADAVDSDGTIASVAFYRGTTLMGTVSTAPFVFNWTNVAAGTYSITSKATDNLGAVTTSSPLTVTVKANVLPSVSLLAPTPGGSYIAPQSMGLSATATDSDGTIARVSYYRDAVLIGSSITPPFAVTWANAPAGTFALTARATDDKGGVTASAPISVEVKPNLLPTVALTSPANNASFAAPGLIPLKVNVTDTDGTIAKVLYYNGTTVVASSTAAPFSANWGNVAVGGYSITAKVNDNKGGVTTSLPVAIEVKPNVLPTISITSPATNTTLVSPTTVTFTTAVADSDGTIKSVSFYSGTTWMASRTSAPYSLTWPNLAVGTHSITAKVIDDKDAVTQSAPVVVVMKANVAPTVTLTAPVSNTTVYGAAVTLAANAADTDGTIGQVAFYNGSTLLGIDTTAPYSFTWLNVANGTYSVSARATDNKGVVQGSTAATVIVKTVPVPTVSITTPVNNARFTAPASFTISAAASVVGDEIAKVEYISSGSVIGTATIAPFSVNLTNVSANTYNVAAKATGRLGGTATSALINLVVGDNALPAVSFAATPATAVAPAAITLNGTATDSDGSVAKVEFFNDAALLSTDTQAPFSFVWSGVAAGTYALKAVATDNLGGAATSAVQMLTVTAPVQAGAPNVYFIHADQINTAREITNASSVKVWEAGTEPFGAQVPNTNPSGQGPFVYNVRFPGQYFDGETGLHYNYHRDYDPQTGRYVQSDPIGLEGGINTYAYVKGNPLTLVDPFGLAEIPPPTNVPGGPWTPNPGAQRPGNFLGPKPSSGGRMQCQWVPPAEDGGPPGSKGYWKTNQAGSKGWSRFDTSGKSMNAEQAHPSVKGKILKIFGFGAAFMAAEDQFTTTKYCERAPEDEDGCYPN